LYPNENEYLNPLEPILKKNFKNINILKTNANLDKLLSDFGLIVLTNNNTSFLEMIGVDKPCILITNPEISFLRSGAEKYFEELKKVGIYHDSIDSCTNQISKIINNINYWWNNDEVIEAKNFFCKRFSRSTNIDLKEIENVLTKI